MKKIIYTILSVSTILLTANFVFATQYACGNGPCYSHFLDLCIGDTDTATNRMAACDVLVNLIRQKTEDLKKQNQTDLNSNNNCQKISQTLWEGNQNQNSTDVLNLQKYLNNYFGPGFDHALTPITEDGIYGGNTSWLVKDFQAKIGIKRTGAVGPKTLAKINSMICGNSNSASPKLSNTVTVNYNSGYFTINLPAGWSYIRGQGTDSFVGKFAGDGIELNFDLGSYGISACESFNQNTPLETFNVNGIPAKTCLSKDSLGELMVGILKIREGYGMGINSRNLNETQKNLFKEIIKTIKFNGYI